MQSGSDAGQDHHPVECKGRLDYAGRPTHAPVNARLFAPLNEDALNPELVTRLEAAFDDAGKKTGAEAITVAVAKLGEGLWSRDAILAPAERLWWASTAKTYVAAVVLQLAEERRLSLGDPISRWVKGVPNGHVITIRDLLQHTSGLFSANEDPTWRANPRRLTPALTLSIVQAHGSMFCPGQHWRYSNSGYTLLGQVIEAVTGHSWQEAVEARIFRRLGLESMRAMRADDPAGIARPRSSKPMIGDPSWTGPAGGIAGTAVDMIRFWAALLEGRIVSPETRDSMFETLYPMFDETSFYGLGTMVFEIADGRNRLLLLGHSGGAPGANAIVAYSPSDRIIVAVAINSDAPAPAVANLMLRTAREQASQPGQ